METIPVNVIISNQKQVSFFYFTGNNSDKLPPAPTANNFQIKWAALLDELTVIEKSFKITDFGHRLVPQDKEFLLVHKILKP